MGNAPGGLVGHVAVILAGLLAPRVACAACHVVTPNGSGAKTGADWNNAYAGLPSTLKRGDTYYLAEGSYSSYTFDTPNSGTSVITIKKAIGADHCTDTGWSTSTMGSGQAAFGPSCNPFVIGDSNGDGYLIIDGQVGTGEVKRSYGIYMQMPFGAVCTSGVPANVMIGSEGGNKSSHVTVRYVELAGSCGGLTEDSTYAAKCNAITDAPVDEDQFLIVNSSDVTIEDTFSHDSSGTFYTLAWSDSKIAILHNYGHLNNQTAANHNNISDLHGGNNDNVTYAYNIWHDVGSSGGAITSLHGGGPTGGTDSNVFIYGNVIWDSPGNPFSKYMGGGLVTCINGNNCPGWKIYNNSFVNVYGGNAQSGGINWYDGATCNGGAAPVIENNLWYLAPSSAQPTFFSTCSGMVEDYNSFLATGTQSFGSGAHDVNDNSSPNPFVNWNAGNFNLTKEDADWTGGLTLPAPYDTDPNGTTRGTDGTWERGAYEFNPSDGGVAPQDGGSDATTDASRPDGGSAGAGSNDAGSDADLNADSGSDAGFGARSNASGGCACMATEPGGTTLPLVLPGLMVMVLWSRRRRASGPRTRK